MKRSPYGRKSYELLSILQVSQKDMRPMVGAILHYNHCIEASTPNMALLSIDCNSYKNQKSLSSRLRPSDSNSHRSVPDRSNWKFIAPSGCPQYRAICILRWYNTHQNEDPLKASDFKQQ